jgi:MFS family permease
MIYDKKNSTQSRDQPDIESCSNESTIDLSGREHTLHLLCGDLDSDLSVISSQELTPSEEVLFERSELMGSTKLSFAKHQTQGFYLIGTLLFCMASADTLILNVAALLPTYVSSHYSNVSSLSVGLLMACYPIAFLVTAPFIGAHMENIGRKTCVVTGMLIMSLAALTIGLASLAKTAEIFFIVSAIARILQGVADASISVAIPGIITMVYPEKKEKYLGYYNMSIGVGTCAGPVLGSLIYAFVGYGLTFACFSALIFVSSIVALMMIPAKLNYQNARLMETTTEQKQISYY